MAYSDAGDAFASENTKFEAKQGTDILGKTTLVRQLNHFRMVHLKLLYVVPGIYSVAPTECCITSDNSRCNSTLNSHSTPDLCGKREGR